MDEDGKSEAKGKGRRLVVRLSAEELAEVERAAGGLEAGAWARGVLLAAARRRERLARLGGPTRGRAQLDIREAAVEPLLAEGRAQIEIARELGCPRQAIYQVVRMRGLARPPRSRLDGRVEEVRALLAAGHSTAEIASRMGETWHGLNYFMRTRGLGPPRPSPLEA